MAIRGVKMKSRGVSKSRSQFVCDLAKSITRLPSPNLCNFSYRLNDSKVSADENLINTVHRASESSIYVYVIEPWKVHFSQTKEPFPRMEPSQHQTLAPDSPAPVCLCFDGIYVHVYTVQASLLTQTLDPSTPCVSTEWLGTFPPGFLAFFPGRRWFFFCWAFPLLRLFFLLSPVVPHADVLLCRGFVAEWTAGLTTRCHGSRKSQRPKYLRSGSSAEHESVRLWWRSRTKGTEGRKGKRRHGPKPKRVLNLGKCRWLLASLLLCLLLPQGVWVITQQTPRDINLTLPNFGLWSALLLHNHHDGLHKETRKQNTSPRSDNSPAPRLRLQIRLPPPAPSKVKAVHCPRPGSVGSSNKDNNWRGREWQQQQSWQRTTRNGGKWDTETRKEKISPEAIKYNLAYKWRLRMT